ncbi:hypothetical protein M9H77_31248 [Catharanthus roseus]|uniref:Uncharacterized protein n=1 Tax=Catharanthus roseus TaxID=4058 RepID=A0ACC0A3G2_CATRO|nr:hypothetical protein M9H77_31248 [Catharanthus roseus]
MASESARLAFRIAVAALLLMLLFYVGRPLYWKISATVHDIRANKQTVSGGWFRDESDSGVRGQKSVAARRFLLIRQKPAVVLFLEVGLERELILLSKRYIPRLVCSSIDIRPFYGILDLGHSGLFLAGPLIEDQEKSRQKNLLVHENEIMSSLSLVQDGHTSPWPRLALHVPSSFSGEFLSPFGSLDWKSPGVRCEIMLPKDYRGINLVVKLGKSNTNAEFVMYLLIFLCVETGVAKDLVMLITISVNMVEMLHSTSFLEAQVGYASVDAEKSKMRYHDFYNYQLMAYSLVFQQLHSTLSFDSEFPSEMAICTAGYITLIGENMVGKL